MTRYVGLIDGEAGGYGIVFPDLPGCTAMGDTVEEAIANGADAMRSWFDVAYGKGPAEGINHPTPLATLLKEPEVADALAEGAVVVVVPLVRVSGRSVKANLSIDEGILAAIDEEAARRKLTRTGFIEVMAREMLPRMAR